MRKEGHVLATIFLMMLFQPDAPAQTKDAAVYVATYIDVQVSSTEQGTTLIRQYREASRMEPGISSIEVVQGIARPNQFVIIESWKDQSSFDAHERASHTVQFRDRLKAIHNSPFDQRVHRGFSVDQGPPAGRIAVIAVTHVDVPPPRTNETELLLKSLADESRKDEGNTRYEVFQQSASRNHFTIVAAWRDRRTFDSYETKPHTRQSREALAPMLGAPYDERLYAPLN